MFLQLILLFIPLIYAEYRDGDIRLVGGSYQWEGRVEIYLSGSWGTIADSDWTEEDAAVTCHTLGHILPGAVPYSNAYFGEGEGPIHLDSVECSGLENRLIECGMNYSDDSINHSLNVGVKCQPAPGSYRDGDYRLVGGAYNWEGRVEIFKSGSWEAINISSWTDDEVKDVCKQLKLNSAVFEHGSSSGMNYIRNATCNSTEANCSYLDDDIMFSYPVGVQCQQGNDDNEGQIRLVGGTVLWEGSLEVYRFGEWRVVSWKEPWKSGFNRNDMNTIVVCRQLGYSIYNLGTKNRYHVARKHYIKLQCDVFDYRIMACKSNGMIQLMYPRGLIVTCGKGDCVTGDIRLMSGETEAEGRVEICIEGEWGTICGHQWTDENTEVVCTQLGFSTVGSYSSKRFGRGSGLIITFANCTRSELRLWDTCSNFTVETECSHFDDIGVHCEPALCSEGQLKLFGMEDYEKIVRICSNQRWETLSSVYWSASNTKVACIELGYADRRYHYYDIVRADNIRHSKHFHCKGNETTLSNCSSINHTVPTPYVKIYCRAVYCTDGDIRLEEGESGHEWEGRLEMCRSGRWGTIGSSGWTQTNTEVVCDTLGYEIPEDESEIVNQMHQSLSKPLYWSNLSCPTNALTLIDCGYDRADAYTIDMDVIVKCNKSSCSDGDLKVVGSNNDFEGRLVICFDQRWTAIVGDGWGDADTKVACRQLGYPLSENPVQTFELVEDSLSLPVKIYQIGCHGHEKTLYECNAETYAMPYFYYLFEQEVDIVTVKCTDGNLPTTMTITNTTIYEPSSESTSGNSSVLTAAITITVMFFVLVICLVVLYSIFKFIQLKKGRETVVMGDNVSYVISSTGRVHAVEDPYYCSILSLAPREEFPPAPKQPLPPIPLTTTVKDEQAAKTQDAKVQETEVKNADKQESQLQETEIQESKAPSSETQGSEAKESETKNTKIKTPCAQSHVYDSCQ